MNINVSMLGFTALTGAFAVVGVVACGASDPQPRPTGPGDGPPATGAGGATVNDGTPSTGGSLNASGATAIDSGGPAIGGASATGGATGVNPGGGATPVGEHGGLSVVGTDLVDQAGNPVQLKGPSAMWLNWENTGFAQDRATVEFIRDDWGGQIVRAAMGVDTPTDTMDPDYLTDPVEATARITGVIDNAIALGMYVIIDWHDHDADLHQAEAIEFFSEMAETYGSLPNVLYEPFNEPVDQSWATIKSYHTAVVDAIRARDPDNVIILGTPNYSQQVNEAAADPVAGSNLMYTLHFYSCTHTDSLRNQGTAALSAGLPLFVTEWGATASDGGVVPQGGGTAELCLDEAGLWHDWMNSNNISWCAWKLDNCTDLSCYFQRTVELPQTQAPWTDGILNGHATFVRGCMQGACQTAPP